MKSSKAETHRLDLVKKIRKSNFEYFNINAINLDFSFEQFGKKIIDPKLIAPFFHQKIVKDKFKSLLKNIVKNINLFELNINVKYTRYYGHGKEDYCFIFDLTDSKMRTIGTLLFSISKEGAIFIDSNDKLDAMHITNELLSKLLVLKKDDVILSVHIYYSNEPARLKRNKKATELAKVKDHFLFQKRVLDFYYEQYNFNILESKGEICHLNMYYLINENINYYWVISKSDIPYENFINYKKKPDFNEETVFQDILRYQIIPPSIQEDCKDGSKEDIFAYYNLMNY